MADLGIKKLCVQTSHSEHVVDQQAFTNDGDSAVHLNQRATCKIVSCVIYQVGPAQTVFSYDISSTCTHFTSLYAWRGKKENGILNTCFILGIILADLQTPFYSYKLSVN